MIKDSKETIIKTEIKHYGRNIIFKEIVVKLSNGRITTRDIVEHPGSVGIIPLLNDETIILLEQYRPSIKKNLLEIPAGTINKNEDPLECARRELLEETGYQSKELKKILEGYTSPGYTSEKMHMFLATQLTYIGSTPEDDEIINIRKVKLKELNKMIENREIEDMKTLFGILKVLKNK
jgi:ADP-ribose pyrophosphatase